MINEMKHRLTPELLMKAIEGEQNAITGYEHLKRQTKDREYIETLNHIIRDEHKHLRSFEELYGRRYNRTIASPKITSQMPKGFMEGVRYSVDEELEAYEMYRDILKDNTGEQVRSIFFEAMTDENEHAIRLNMMYAQELGKRAF